jgi:hypothetical protein
MPIIGTHQANLAFTQLIGYEKWHIVLSRPADAMAPAVSTSYAMARTADSNDVDIGQRSVII